MAQTWIVASSVLIPTLVGTHPILLAAVHGSGISVASAAAFSRSEHVAFYVPVIVPLPLWLVVNTISWWAGRRLGPHVVDWISRRHPVTRPAFARVERLVNRTRFVAVTFAYLIPVPTAMVHAACGWLRMPLALFLAAATLAVLTRNSIFAIIGYTAGDLAVSMAVAISQEAALITGALVVTAVLVFAGRRIIRSRRRDGT